MTPTGPSPSIAGTAKVVRFNWPKYVAVGALLAAASIASILGAPVVVRAGLWLVAGAGSVWTITSLAATWWVYDHRRVYDHLTRGLADTGSWASVHAGFDDATPALVHALGSFPVDVVELAMPASASLRRARRDDLAHHAAAFDALPLATGTLDTVFVTFAAHEVRDPGDQRALFTELRRVLRPGGRLVVTEHARDLANLAVYGPGAMHFQRRAVWRRRAADAGLVTGSDTTISPFVHRMTWHR